MEQSNSSRDPYKLANRLPMNDSEYRRLRHLVIHDGVVTDDQVAEALPKCLRLETVVLQGVPDVTDRTVAIISTAPNLQRLDLSGCKRVTDVGVLNLTASKSTLQWLYLNNVTSLTDASISAVVKSCLHLRELELSGLPFLTSIAVRDLWPVSRKLKALRLARCPLLTDVAFPAFMHTIPSHYSETNEKPLPSRPMTLLEGLPPLILSHIAENLRVLDLGYCSQLTDRVIKGIVAHAPRIRALVLSGCSVMTDNAIDCICQLGDHLETLMVAHLAKVTDRGIMKLARSCSNLRSLDVSCTLAKLLIFAMTTQMISFEQFAVNLRTWRSSNSPV